MATPDVALVRLMIFTTAWFCRRLTRWRGPRFLESARPFKSSFWESDTMAEAVSTGKSPVDDTRALLARLEGPDESAAAAVRQLYAESGKPRGSLGRLEDFAEWLAAWTGKVPPVGRRPLGGGVARGPGGGRRGGSPPAGAAAPATGARGGG